MDTPPHRYVAYGLRIRSDFALPELAPGREEDGVDLSIVRAVVPPLPNGDQFDFAPGRAYMGWTGVARFLLIGADRIEAEVDAEGSDRLLALPLLGPVIALVLHLRGLLVLHGSALAVGGAGVAFLGDKGAGKSTTAAALHRAGHALLSDDVLAVDVEGEQAPRLLSAYPQIKLTDSASQILSPQAASAQPSPHPEFQKRIYRLERGFSEETVAPRRIYALSRGPEAAVTPLEPMAALGVLLRFSYITRFGDRVIRGEAAARHLRQCAALARSAQVRGLTAPDGLDRLDGLVALVERDVAGARGA